MDDSFGSSVPSDSPAIAYPPRVKNGTPAKLFGRNLFTVPSSSPLSARGSSVQSDRRETDNDEQGREEEDDAYDESMPLDIGLSDDGKPGTPSFGGFTSINAGPAFHVQSSISPWNHQSTKNSRVQASMRNQGSASKISQLPHKGQGAVIPGIARDLASRSAPVPLSEPDDLILQTEDLLIQLNEEIEGTDDDAARAVLSLRTNELTRFWQTFNRDASRTRPKDSIGPDKAATGLEKAIFLSTLFLALHHPPVLQPPLQRGMPSPSTSNQSLALSALIPAPIPQILLDWLDCYHVSYNMLLEEVRSAQPNCTAHNFFWDATHALLLRGKLQDVRQLFGEADFKYAATAMDEGAEEPGYSGSQLQVIQGAIYRAQQIVDACPGLREGDWQMNGADWELYRKRVAIELEHLTDLAEGRADEDDDAFQAENFGIRRPSNSLTKAGDKPPRKLPWSVYEQLKITYSILLGSVEEITAQSQDWLEAAMALTIWWDGSDDNSVANWRLSISRSQREHLQDVENPFLSRLAASFLCVTDPDDKDSFQVNTMSLVEVGLACVLQGDVEGLLSSLQAFSLPIAAATAETGLLAGWLEALGSSESNGLDDEDLMVLGLDAAPRRINKDDILLAYAEALFDRGELQLENSSKFEGWELAIALTMRFDDRELAGITLSKFLDQLHLMSQARMDKLVNLCTELGLETEARKVSERFADHLANTTSTYGTALICYARAHAASKIKQLVDLLVSYSLVQSAAYPAADELDYNLRVLVETPKMALAGLAEIDPQAAKILQFSLSGYACLRRFYTLRDEDILAKKQNRKANMRPLARRRAAAKALVAAINSAADSIYGGLYDADRESAIQVDGLSTLLGEATAFLSTSQQKAGFNAAQMYDILAAVEDLQTVNARVYDAAEDCLQASLRNYHGSAPPSPRAMLQKSVSSGANSNFSFSMMGSEMLARSAESSVEKSIGGSGVLVSRRGEVAERGWDWRAAFRPVGIRGADVLKVLRMGIAKDLSMAQLEEGV